MRIVMNANGSVTGVFGVVSFRFLLLRFLFVFVSVFSFVFCFSLPVLTALEPEDCEGECGCRQGGWR
jgi:hypothetical protein